MSAPGGRSVQAATFAAIAGLLNSPGAQPPFTTRMTFYAASAEDVRVLISALPLRWKAQPPRPGENTYTFTGEAGFAASGVASLRVTIAAPAGQVATENGTRTVTVTEWTPAPEIAALLNAEGTEAA